MRFEDFIERFGDAPLIDSRSFNALGGEADQLRVQVHGWTRQGKMHALKRGVYILDARYRRAPASPAFVANYLVSPSYLSLEYALAHYSLIPERPTAYTSVSTRNTRRFETVLGTFTYRTVKREAFFGMTSFVENGQECVIATPEKALLDYFYLNSGHLEATPGQVAALRLQNHEQLDWPALREGATRMNGKVCALVEAAHSHALSLEGSAT